MTIRLLKSVLSACCLLAVTVGCKKPAKVSSGSADKKADVVTHELTASKNYESGPAKFDVCALLRTEEIQNVTGVMITQSNGSGRSNGNLRTAQCVYLPSQPSQSISLVVTRSGSTTKQNRGARDFWRERFDRYRKQVEEKKEEEDKKAGSHQEMEEEREGRPPRKVEDVGEEAFWTAGSLYVLQNDFFLRLSVGGAEAEETKLEHSRALAALALKRLQSLPQR